MGIHDVVSEGRLLQQGERVERVARVRQQLRVLGPPEVLEVLEVRDEGGVLKVLRLREVVQVEGVG